MNEERFIALGLGRFVRADRVIALEPIEGERRGPGRRTLVWVDGLADPIVASRGEQGILGDLVGDVRAGAMADAGDVLDADETLSGPPVDPPPSLF